MRECCGHFTGGGESRGAAKFRLLCGELARGFNPSGDVAYHDDVQAAIVVTRPSNRYFSRKVCVVAAQASGNTKIAGHGLPFKIREDDAHRQFFQSVLFITKDVCGGRVGIDDESCIIEGQNTVVGGGDSGT